MDTATKWMVAGTVVMALATVGILVAAAFQAAFSKRLTRLQEAIVSLETKQHDERNRWDIRLALAHSKEDTNKLALRIGNLSTFSVWIESVTLQARVDGTQGPPVKQSIQRVVKPSGTIELVIQQKAQDTARPLNVTNTGDIDVDLHVTLNAFSGSRGSFTTADNGLVKFRGWNANEVHS